MAAAYPSFIWSRNASANIPYFRERDAAQPAGTREPAPECSALLYPVPGERSRI
jgi:hypothetical protein